MNFLQLKQELARQCGMDQSITADDTSLGVWVNMAYRRILGETTWPFNRASNPIIIQTVADFTTGTATVAAGGTSVTLSSAPTVSRAGDYIQFASSDDWYRITVHAANDTAVTITPGAISAEAATAFTIRRFTNSLGTSGVDRIISLRQEISSPYTLAETTKEVFNMYRAHSTETGTPRLFWIDGKNSSGYWQVGLWPWPDASINIQVEYLAEVADLSATTDTPVVPLNHHDTIIDTAKQYAYGFLDDSRRKEALLTAEAGLERMKKTYRQGLAKRRMFKPFDEPPPSRIVPFPEEFGNV